MPRGRKPVPAELKLMRGKPGHRRIESTAAAVGDLAGPPEHFDQEHRDLWDYAVAHAAPGILKLADASVLEIWVDAYVTYRAAMAAVNREGPTIIAARGGECQNPNVLVADKQAHTMLRATEHLGFSPMSRARVHAPAPKTDTGGWDEVKTGS